MFNGTKTALEEIKDNKFNLFEVQLVIDALKRAITKYSRELEEVEAEYPNL